MQMDEFALSVAEGIVRNGVVVGNHPYEAYSDKYRAETGDPDRQWQRVARIYGCQEKPMVA